MYVLCRSLKDFTALREFQQSELMKEGRDALIAKDKRVSQLISFVFCNYNCYSIAIYVRVGIMTSFCLFPQKRTIASAPLPRIPINAEREKKRKQFYKQQQDKLYEQETHLLKKDRQAYFAKIMELEERRKQREKIDMERDAEKQRRELTQLREEFEVHA